VIQFPEVCMLNTALKINNVQHNIRTIIDFFVLSIVLFLFENNVSETGLSPSSDKSLHNPETRTGFS
jgi:hypothetical protein